MYLYHRNMVANTNPKYVELRHHDGTKFEKFPFFCILEARSAKLKQTTTAKWLLFVQDLASVAR